MFAQTIMMLAAAAAVAIDPGSCRRTASGRTGAAAWESDGKGHLSVSMDVPSRGDVSLECRVRIPAGARVVTLLLDRARLSFQPSGSKTEGSGLVLELGGSCNAGLTRVAGEDWLETRKRAWTMPVPEKGGRSMTVRVTGRDVSDHDPLRVDLDGLRILFEEVSGATPCP